MSTPPVASGDGDPLDRLITQAEQLMLIRRYEQAAPVLERVLVSDPDHSRALELRAMLLWIDGRFDESVALAKRLIAAHPEEPYGYRVAAETLHDQGHNSEAESFARLAVARNPEYHEAQCLLGQILAKLPGREDEARAVLDTAIRLDPERATGHRALAEALMSFGEWEAAEKAALDAVSRAPDQAVFRMRLALARLGAGHYEEAEQDVHAAVALEPHLIRFEGVVADLEWHGLPGQLRDLYVKACQASDQPDLSEPGSAGDDPALLQRQAELADRLLDTLGSKPRPPDRFDRAERLVDAILAADPGQRLARHLRAMLLARAGNWTEAIKTETAVLAEKFRPRWTHQVTLDGLDEVGLHAEGLQAAREILSWNPDSKRFRWYEAYFLLQVGEAAEGLKVAREMQADGADNTDYLIGRALYQTGDLAAAEPVLRSAIEANSTDAESLVWLALLLRDRGEPGAAAAVARRAAALEMECLTERRLLTDLLAELGESSPPSGGPPGDPPGGGA